jgi:aubergine-like protein
MVEASQGQVVKVTTNFFNLRRSPVNNITVYALSFTPDVEPENRTLRGQLLGNGKTEVEGRIGKFIKSGNVLFSKTLVQSPISVQVKSHDNTEYIMILTPTGTITGENVDSYRMYANSALKKMLQQLDLKQVTKMPKYYDTRQTQRVDQHGLEVWRGYTATFSHHLRDMLLNLDFSSKIIRDTTAFQHIEDIRSQMPQGQNLEQYINNQINGMIVMAKYGNYKCYRIDRIILNENPGSSFNTKGGSMKFTEYYKNRYNITIKNMRQPLLLTTPERGQDAGTKLVPELCVLTGISEDMRRDFRAMNDIAAFTRLAPADRLNTAIGLSRRLAEDRACRAICDEYCMEIDPRPIVVDGIKLPAEQIKVGPADSDTIGIDQRGNFVLRSRLMDSKPIDNWCILTTERDAGNRDKVIKTLMNKAQQINLRLGQPIQMDYQPRTLKDIIQRLNVPSGGRPVPQIALVVIGPNDKRGYNDIKEACALTSGIPTQCLKANNVNNPKKVDSIMSKLIVQMAVKTGSAAWQMTKNPPGIPVKTMVVGIDVFHDTVLKAKSVLGFVASIHPQFHNYFNTTRIHSKVGEEIGGHVGDCLREALVAFHEATKGRFLPETIVVYRDGVADSQIEAARRFEVEAMKRAIRTFNGYNPNLVYVLVNKKTNCKLYSQGNRGMDNPQPGTMVNSVIIPESQSFYLVAHAVTQGMASPTLYRIISNDGNVDSMAVARLAFKLCYMYYNWTGAIKVPAPTMMAHKLAYLVGQSVHATHVQALRTLPWFY